MAEHIDKRAIRDALYDADAISMRGVELINQFPVVNVQCMSILINGMEMPKDGCRDCILVNRKWHGDVCPILKREVTGNVERGGFQTDCPLIKVPEPHGRLIDADAVIDLVMQYCPDDDGVCSKAGADLRELLDEIENLPTNISAEEGE